MPVIIGSGLDPDNAARLLAHCDGAVVGTSLMVDAKVHVARARALTTAVAKLRP